VIFKIREWYYIVSMYNYYHLTVFLVLIGKESLTKSQTFNPDWPDPGHIRANELKWGENMILNSQEWYCIVFIYKYYQLNLFLDLIRKFEKKFKISTPIVLK